MPLDRFRSSVTKLVEQIEASRPATGDSRVRVPGRSSAIKRREAEKAGMIEVDEAIHEALERMRRGDAETIYRATELVGGLAGRCRRPHDIEE